MATSTTMPPGAPETPAQEAAAHHAWAATRKRKRGYPEVCWNFEDTQPPGGEYITRDSYLLFTSYRNALGEVLTISARLLLPNGQIKICQWAQPNLNGQQLQQSVWALDEGFLLSLGVAIASPSNGVQRGDTFVQVGLQYGAAIGSPLYRVLVSDYVTTTRALGWPDGPLNDNVSGPGLLLTRLGGVPGAGLDFTVGGSANTRAWVHSLYATLTTSAAVANRSPLFEVLDSAANILWAFGPTAVQAASLTYIYNLTECVTEAADVGANKVVPFPTEMFLSGQFTIKSVTSGIQAGDQWSAPIMLFEMWQMY